VSRRVYILRGFKRKQIYVERLLSTQLTLLIIYRGIAHLIISTLLILTMNTIKIQFLYDLQKHLLISEVSHAAISSFVMKIRITLLKKFTDSLLSRTKISRWLLTRINFSS